MRVGRSLSTFVSREAAPPAVRARAASGARSNWRERRKKGTQGPVQTFLVLENLRNPFPIFSFAESVMWCKGTLRQCREAVNRLAPHHSNDFKYRLPIIRHLSLGSYSQPILTCPHGESDRAAGTAAAYFFTPPGGRRGPPTDREREAPAACLRCSAHGTSCTVCSNKQDQHIQLMLRLRVGVPTAVLSHLA